MQMLIIPEKKIKSRQTDPIKPDLITNSEETVNGGQHQRTSTYNPEFVD